MRNSLFRFVLILTLLFPLAACSTFTLPSATTSTLPLPTSTQTTPTFESSSTEFPITEQSILTQTPETSRTEPPTPSPTLTETPNSSPTPFSGTPTPTRRPTWTRTPSRTPIPPLAGIRITRPGLLSKVLSPFRLEAAAIPAPDGRIYIALIGEDGSILYNHIVRFAQTTANQVFLQEEIEFSISGVAETARLILYSMDLYGRTISLSSVDLLLLSLGDEKINPPVSLREPLFIIRPFANETFANGNINITGLVSPVSNQPVIVEIISEQNQVLFSTSLDAGPVTPERAYVPFEINLPYSVSVFTRARLTLRQDSDTRIPGSVAISSQLITFSP